ncbi:MAG: DUF1320 domain-containing protein [Gammaproteobacteria bacterium]|nr:DUF1320 domain-containing protein [Gammaproteobacteria bacterium]
MPYATAQDIIDRYGNDQLLLIADRDGDGLVDAAVVDQALADASAEIDAYLATRYELPMAPVPTVLVRVCVDIVMYRLAADADMATEEKRIRFDDVITLLSRISTGKVSLGVVTPPESSNGAVLVNGPGRRFGRDKLL